jgi:SAM-dependent methyltransferase
MEYNMVRIALRAAAQPANLKTYRWPFCECTAMDLLTKAYYASNTGDCAARYETADVPSLHQVLRSFGEAAPRVLEIGGGSGRDAAFLLHLGCDTTYTDGCEEMVAQALELHPELAGRGRCAAFPLCDDDDLLRQRFNLVLCAAVIMHLDDPSLEHLASQVARLILDGGHLVLSHSRGHRCARGNRDSGGRLFLERTPAIVDRIFESVGFRPVQLIENPDGLGRDGISWATHVLQKTP